MTKEALFVPGHGLQPHVDYPATGFELGAAGFAVHGIAPYWGRPFNTLATQVRSEIEGRLNRDTVAVGHAIGSNLLLAALQALGRGGEIGGLVLISPSVVCEEGLAYERGGEMVNKYFPAQIDDVSEFSIAGAAVGLGIPPERVAVLIGEREASQYPHRGDLAEIMAAAFDVRMTVVPGAGQSIEHSVEYVQAVGDAAQRVYEAAQA